MTHRRCIADTFVWRCIADTRQSCGFSFSLFFFVSLFLFLLGISGMDCVPLILNDQYQSRPALLPREGDKGAQHICGDYRLTSVILNDSTLAI